MTPRKKPRACTTLLPATCAARRRCATTRKARRDPKLRAPPQTLTHHHQPPPTETAKGFPDCLLQQMPHLAATNKRGKRAASAVETQVCSTSNLYARLYGARALPLRQHLTHMLLIVISGHSAACENGEGCATGRGSHAHFCASGSQDAPLRG